MTFVVSLLIGQGCAGHLGGEVGQVKERAGAKNR